MKPQNTILVLCIIFHGILLVQTHMISSSRLGNETDQLALLQFKSQIATNEVLTTWNKSVPHCQWRGVTCGPRHSRVIGLDLSGQNLFGTISPHIGNLSFLRSVNLTANTLNGEIPQEIGRLTRLRYLNLFNNTLGGAIPKNLGYSTELNFLDLTKNNLTGKIPTDLRSLKKLLILSLGENSLTGEIPHSLGNLSSLKIISVADNHLQGRIPNELSKLTNLTNFQIGINNISGVFPSYLFNISSIIVISTAGNPISGSLPTDIGFTLPNLRLFGIGGNLFTGTIPKSLANVSQLTLIDIAGNGFVGQVPHSLGSLPGLQLLNLGRNQLGGDPTQDLSFLEPLSNCTNLNNLYFVLNNMTGKLPDSIANLSIHLKGLGMGGNKISGHIPEAIGNLNNLYILSMEQNLLSGVIPSSLGRLQKLQKLYINQNQLFGEIPSSLGDLSELSELNLSFNRLEGSIPETIGNCGRMQYLNLSNNNLSGIIPPRVMGIASFSYALDLSHNWLSGPLPAEVGKLISLNTLKISNNNLTGEIPEVVGNCLSLEYLNLSRNSFRGIIPYTLANLKGIRYLDLSQNNLSGKIPEAMETLVYLQNLNLSFNDLVGEIPTRGAFGNVSAISLAGNSKLCGGVTELKQPPCPNTEASKKQKFNFAVKLIIALVCAILFLIVITSFGALYWRRKKRKVSVASLEKDKHMRISYWELHRATNGFSSENSIGSGSFGTVYKGKLNQQADKLVAVKVLNLQHGRASKSFVAECRILRNIRHRNLVKILTYCSSIDSRNDDFKALVYEYMLNGNLDIWLHPGETNTLTTLNLLQRLNIATDVACAVHYLHNNCEPPVIHCDLKPSNILLDSEMCAHVGDFGLARFLPELSGAAPETSSIGVKGTIGYAAPEYGNGGDISTHGDVYAFGILLLEMIIGRRPTDDIFKDGLTLHTYARNALPNQVREIVDPILDREQQEALGDEERGGNNDEKVEMNERRQNIGSSSRGEFEKNIISILGIALACSEESPTNRMDMNDITRELHRVKGAIVGNRRTRH